MTETINNRKEQILEEIKKLDSLKGKLRDEYSKILEQESNDLCKNCIKIPYCEEWSKLYGCGGYLDLKILNDWMDDNAEPKKYILSVGLNCFNKKDIDGIGKILCVMDYWSEYSRGGNIETLQEFRNKCEELLF